MFFALMLLLFRYDALLPPQCRHVDATLAMMLIIAAMIFDAAMPDFFFFFFFAAMPPFLLSLFAIFLL